MTAGSAATVRALRDALGLPDPAQQHRERVAQGYDRLVQRGPQQYRTLGEAMDYAGHERPQSAEQMLQFSNAGDGNTMLLWDDSAHLPGELTGNNRASINRRL